MADILKFPGVYRPDLEKEVTPKAVLEGALRCGLRDVAIVGRALSGEIVVATSSPDPDAGVGLLMRGVTWLATRDVDHVIEDDEDDEEDDKPAS